MMLVRPNKRIDPRDLDKSKAVGISIPFNGSNVFNSTFSTEHQIKSNIINLLLTNKGERIQNPTFGVDIYKNLFEVEDVNVIDTIENQIREAVDIFIPEIELDEVEVELNPDSYSINITVGYRYIISNSTDSVFLVIS